MTFNLGSNLGSSLGSNLRRLFFSLTLSFFQGKETDLRQATVKKNRACTGFEPLTSAIAVQRSTD